MSTQPEPELVRLLRQDGVKLKLSRSSNRYRGACPFHQDRRPSFEVYQSKRGYWWYRCRSTACEAHGNTDDYRRHTRRPVEERRPATPQAQPRRPDFKPVAPELHHQAMQHYNQQLLRNAAATDYLQRRGIDPTQSHRWGIGYAPGDTLYRILSRELSERELETCPLLDHRRREDRAARRIIIPHRPRGDDRPWHTARAIDPDRHLPYLSLPGPRPALLIIAPEPARRQRSVIITEGPFDLIATLTAGYHGAATAGNPHPEALALALTNYREVYILPDRDEGGEGWASIVAQAARAAGATPIRLSLPAEYPDPADIMLRRRPTARAVYGTMLRLAALTPQPPIAETNASAKQIQPTKESTTMAEYRGAGIEFFGNLTSDPEDRTDYNRERPNHMATFRVAKNYQRWSSQDQANVDQVAFYNCTAFGVLATQILRRRKGDHVWVKGNHQPRDYQGNDGLPHRSDDVLVTDLHAFIRLDRPENGGGENPDDRQGQQDQRQNYGPGPRPGTGTPTPVRPTPRPGAVRRRPNVRRL